MVSSSFISKSTDSCSTKRLFCKKSCLSAVNSENDAGNVVKRLLFNESNSKRVHEWVITGSEVI